ncbi:MAG: nucleotidyltransferase [Deltaproteobacteria bacterium]|nr:nucleotidyltransferase [Deltaproteobacteria bacterium]
MTIPESQLETWSNQGAIVTSQKTHRSIRTALSSFNWSSAGVVYNDYLQGSYRNSTNIRGDSDVDLVIELTSTMYSNLTAEENVTLGIEPTDYGWQNFRQDVISVLTHYYGAEYIDTSASKSIKVLPNSGRLKADVVVCAKYCHYSDLRLVGEGMTFWTIPGWQQIINYPKLHYSNGATKNSQQHTRGWYKPVIRMFKNARNRILIQNPHLSNRFPSYFIECLLYNVHNRYFGRTYQDTYVSVVNWLDEQFTNNNVAEFVSQNKMHYLFGEYITQWSVSDAKEYTNQLSTLWNNW